MGCARGKCSSARQADLERCSRFVPRCASPSSMPTDSWRVWTRYWARCHRRVAAEYTPEVVAELERVVARDLSCWQLSAATEVRLLNLSENATFALSDPLSAREVILRVHRVG